MHIVDTPKMSLTCHFIPAFSNVSKCCQIFKYGLSHIFLFSIPYGQIIVNYATVVWLLLGHSPMEGGWQYEYISLLITFWQLWILYPPPYTLSSFTARTVTLNANMFQHSGFIFWDMQYALWQYKTVFVFWFQVICRRELLNCYLAWHFL